MKELWVRIISLASVVATLFGYNMVLEARDKDEQIAKLSVQITGMQETYGKAEGKSAEESGDKQGKSEYKDGTYTGEADGFGGKIDVEVIIKDGKMTEVNLLSAENEDGVYLSMAEEIIPKIIEVQRADTDTISGATFSSAGIRDAVVQALEKAVE